MATRHGFQLSATSQPRWMLGIWKIFDPWVDPQLLLLQGHTVPMVTRPLTIEFHFRSIVRRLVRSLARLHLGVREWDHFLDAGGLTGVHPELVFEIPEECGISADSVFHYLNLFIDDLARVVPFILAADGTAAKEPEGFSDLKTKLISGEIQASSSLIELFEELNCDESWWFHGFKRGAGIRQRLTHYTDMVYFQGKTKSGDLRMTGNVSIISVGGPVHVQDFEGALQELFGRFCEWLERLDQLLLRHLSEKLAEKGVPWNPFIGNCPSVALPSQEEIRLGMPHYLYLPCVQ